MKLLIVDDSERFRLFVRALLADLCAQVEECANGEAAIAAYTADRPDWVLMDLRMEPIDGLTATQAIRARDQTARVIIITSLDDEHVRRVAHEAGACAFLSKDDLSGLKPMLAEGGSMGRFR